MKPVEVDPQNGYRYYSPDQVQQLNALLELKALGFSLDEIKTVMAGETTKERLVSSLQKKQQAWLEAMEAARYKAECVDEIISNLQSSRSADRIAEMTDEERAWLLVKMVCIEDIRAQKTLSEALWV